VKRCLDAITAAVETRQHRSWRLSITCENVYGFQFFGIRDADRLVTGGRRVAEEEPIGNTVTHPKFIFLRFSRRSTYLVCFEYILDL
jgi:hypothetical protein